MEYMNLVDPATGEPSAEGNRLIGSFSGVFQAGAFFGVIIASWVMDRFGRKAGVAYCCFFSLFGGAWLTGSTDPTMVRETARDRADSRVVLIQSVYSSRLLGSSREWEAGAS